MQNTITEIKKKSLEAANSRIQEAEVWKSEVEDKLVEIMDAEQKKNWKEMKRVSENSETTWNTPTSIL